MSGEVLAGLSLVSCQASTAQRPLPRPCRWRAPAARRRSAPTTQGRGRVRTLLRRQWPRQWDA